MPEHRYEIVWVGDLLLADAAQRYLDKHGYDWPFAYLRPLLTGDYLIGNAEGPITERTEKHFPEQRWSYHAQPASASALAALGFDAMSLSNNHAFDRGDRGLADTIAHLASAGVVPFGAGMNANEASTPLLVGTPFGTLAVIGISLRWKYGQVAGPDTPGTIALSEETITKERALALEAGARWVIAFVHWGKNYAPITNAQREYAAQFAAAGYDLVIGTGAHITQPVEIVDGMPVVFSLGNFVFGSRGRFTDEAPGYGLVARTVFTDDGLRRIEFRCVATNNRQVTFQPRPCDPETAQQVVKELGPAAAWDGTAGIVSLG